MGRVVGAGDPAWLAEDVDLALEWQGEQDVTCRGCGHPIDETTDPDNEGLYEAHQVTCLACEVMRRRAATFKPDELPGVRFYAVKTEE
jgi:hypothetical protein